jgi:glycosyltransferase involved in cell wall biosynthesis
LRIAFLHGSNDLYGASRVLAQDVELLLAQGHEVVVALPADGPLTAVLRNLGAHVSVESLRVLRRVDGAAAARPPARLPSACEDADVVVVWTLALAAYLPLLRIRRRRVVCSVHEILPGVPGRLLAAAACVCAHALMVNSKATARWLTGDFKSRRAQLAYPIAPPYRPADRQPGAPGSLRLLLMGRVNGSKGQLEAVRATQAARAGGADIQLTLLGGSFAGQERHLAELLAAIGELSWAHYGGEVSDPEASIGACDVVLIPSTKPESFGIVALEAWAAGRRVIASDEGGLSEAAGMVQGLLVAPADVGELCRAIERVAHDPRLRAGPPADAAAGELCTRQARELAWEACLTQAARR